MKRSRFGEEQIIEVLKTQTDCETFYLQAPRLSPSRTLITGVVCGHPAGRVGPVPHEGNSLSR